MSKFHFLTDEQSEAYYAKTIQIMVQQFGLSEDEARTQVHNECRGLPVIVPTEISKFHFLTDEQSEAYCDEIIQIMVQQFELSEDEARTRMNNKWREWPIIGPTHYIYHELPEYWANDIYFGKDSRWWLNKPGF